MRLPFVGQAYTMPSLDLDAQNCINWFLVNDPTGKFPQALMPFPGHKIYSEEIEIEYSVRGMKELNNKLYAVVDNILYRIYNSGERRILGTLNTSVGHVIIIANQTQLFITDGFYGYVYQVLPTDDYEIGEFTVITQTSSVVGDPTFTGTGLDDLSTAGTYTGTNNKTYRVEIQTAGTPDKYRWSDSDGETWNVENLDIIAGAVTLNDGVQIEFENTTGHSAKDYWRFDVSTDDVFYPPRVPTVVDGYGIFEEQSTNRFFITGIDDFRSINALDFARAGAKPDYLIACVSVRKGELWLFCRSSLEVWYDVGGATFPFQPRSNFLKNFGCIAPYSIATTNDNIICWLGTNEEGHRCMLTLSDYQVKVISKQPLNDELATYRVVDDARGVSFFYKGQTFYAVIFPTEDETWVYNFNTDAWQERLTWYLTDEPKEQEYHLGRWSANCYAYFDGKHLIGDFESGNIYELDADTYTEKDGTPIILERSTQHMQEDLARLFFEWIIVDFQAGVGTEEIGQGIDPKIMLMVSKDGGHAWLERTWRSIGKIGKRKKRAKWNKFGFARNWTFRLRVSDPVYRVLLGVVGEAEVSEE